LQVLCSSVAVDGKINV